MLPRFYYNLQTVHFVSDFDKAIMDKYVYTLQAPAKAAGIDVLVPVFDIGRIYSPYMSVKIDGKTATAQMNDRTVRANAGEKLIYVNDKSVELRNPAEIIEGVFYVPVGDFMQFGFGKKVKSSADISPEFLSAETVASLNMMNDWPKKDVVVAVSDESELHIDGMFLRYINVLKRNKKYGEQYKTYWLEEGKKVIPYILYVPYKYDSKIPSKLVVFLHGGSIDVGEKYAFQFSNNKIQPVCEKYNYILLCPNGYSLLSAYGNLKSMGAENLSPQEIEWRKLGDKSVMKAIDVVKSEYNIDASHIYLMGNSMGGMGTFYLPAAHPGVFRAIAPSGAGAEIDSNGLKGVPILFTAGTEDCFGLDILENCYTTLKNAGLDIEFNVVGGGMHLDAWASVLDEIFGFFEKHA